MSTEFVGLASNDNGERNNAIERSADVMEPQNPPLESVPEAPLDWALGWPDVIGPA